MKRTYDQRGIAGARQNQFPVLRGLALLAFLGATAVSFSLFVRYERFCNDQRRLYQQYLSINEWWFTIKPAFDSTQPLFDRVEAVDPHTADPEDLSALSSALEARRRFFSEIQDPMFFPAHDKSRDLVPQVASLILRHEDYLMDMRCLTAVRNDTIIPALQPEPPSPTIFKRPASLNPTPATAWRTLALVGAYPSMMRFKGSLGLRYKALYNDEKQLSAVQVRADARAVTRAYLASMKADRSSLTRLMSRPAQVPLGLNLEFARRLGLGSQ